MRSFNWLNYTAIEGLVKRGIFQVITEIINILNTIKPQIPLENIIRLDKTDNLSLLAAIYKYNDNNSELYKI